MPYLVFASSCKAFVKIKWVQTKNRTWYQAFSLLFDQGSGQILGVGPIWRTLTFASVTSLRSLVINCLMRKLYPSME